MYYANGLERREIKVGCFKTENVYENESDSSAMINVAWRRDKEGGGILTTRASESEETR